MAKHIEFEQVLALLKERRFDDLIGAVEHDQFDAKSHPYILDSDKRRLELAKDVVGFANQRGGVIVLGARTTRKDEHLGDEVTKIRFIDHALIQEKQYHDVLNSWIYPPLPNIPAIEYFPSPNPQKGLFAITIPPQPEEEKYFLLTKSLLDDDIHRDIVMGIAQRIRAETPSISVASLYALIRDGRRFENIMHQQLESLGREVTEIRQTLREIQGSPKEDIPPPVSREELEARLKAAVRELERGK